MSEDKDKWYTNSPSDIESSSSTFNTESSEDQQSSSSLPVSSTLICTSSSLPDNIITNSIVTSDITSSTYSIHTSSSSIPTSANISSNSSSILHTNSNPRFGNMAHTNIKRVPPMTPLSKEETITSFEAWRGNFCIPSTQIPTLPHSWSRVRHGIKKNGGVDNTGV